MLSFKSGINKEGELEITVEMDVTRLPRKQEAENNPLSEFGSRLLTSMIGVTTKAPEIDERKGCLTLTFRNDEKIITGMVNYFGDIAKDQAAQRCKQK